MQLSLIQQIALYAIPALFAITLHEVAHGYVARHFGDRTAEMLGRLTLNPLKHVDPVGTIAVPIGMLVMSKAVLGTPLIFGWARPVPVATRNLRRPRRDMTLVAAAGPASNLIMALGWALIVKLVSLFGPAGHPVSVGLFLMASFGITINVVLAVLNMLPIPPLDGGRVASGLLPPRASTALERIEPYGFIILVGLMVTGVLWPIMTPLIIGTTGLIQTLAGI